MPRTTAPRYQETIVAPPVKTFRSSGGHVFVIRQGKRAEWFPNDPKGREEWQILYNNKPAGSLRHDNQFGKPRWQTDARELSRDRALGAPVELGLHFDLGPFESYKEAIAAFGATADRIFRYEEERVQYRRDREARNKRLPRSSCSVLHLPHHSLKRQPDPPGTARVVARFEDNDDVAFKVRSSRKGKDWWVSAERHGYRKSDTLHTSKPETAAYWIEAVQSGRVQVGTTEPATVNKPLPGHTIDKQVPDTPGAKILNKGKGPVCAHPHNHACITCSRFHTKRRHDAHTAALKSQ